MFHKHPRNDPSSAQKEITLADHIKNIKQEIPKKLTYEEWRQSMIKLYGYCPWQCEEAWKAAQENI